MQTESDVIGGFFIAETACRGCGSPLLLENAWMTDGCPCNSELGVNSMNETRWRLLMELQQKQARELELYKLQSHSMAEKNTILRKIAAHVPARTWLAAKEKAGFGTEVRASQIDDPSADEAWLEFVESGRRNG